MRVGPTRNAPLLSRPPQGSLGRGTPGPGRSALLGVQGCAHPPLGGDAARFAENAWLVTGYEAAWRDMRPRQVAEQAFRSAGGCLMSAKKDRHRPDGLSHLNHADEVLASTVKDKARMPGYRPVEQPPLVGHFRCKLEPVRT
ncbi:hypothetical protein [Streptomyces hawaiiensis]|uniref:hypothetical protein n=1 Tax=Streptomyces hawaiiensis TaxID=67305 RepID=UPI00365BC74F